MKKILIIGSGNMGSAIAEGIATKRLFTKNNIILIDKYKKKLARFKKFGYIIYTSISEIQKKDLKNITAILLAVKPNDIKPFLTENKNLIPKQIPIISIAAGIKIKTIESLLHKKQPICRVMPNTPCQIGEGISALAYNKNTTANHKHLVKKIFTSIGDVVELDEDKFDIVTAISGSGPAYFCYLLENIIKAGERSGLTSSIAKKLAMKTALGTYKLLSTNQISPIDLRKTVTSPNGTTYAAIKSFDNDGFSNIIIQGIKNAKNRSIELGKDS